MPLQHNSATGRFASVPSSLRGRNVPVLPFHWHSNTSVAFCQYSIYSSVKILYVNGFFLQGIAPDNSVELEAYPAESIKDRVVFFAAQKISTLSFALLDRLLRVCLRQLGEARMLPVF